jgi:hypothetical protein
MPVTVFLWTIGWCLFWIGSQNETHRTQVADDSSKLSLAVMFPEEHEVLSK